MQDRQDGGRPAAAISLLGVAVLAGATAFYCAAQSFSSAHEATPTPPAAHDPFFPLHGAAPVVDLAPDDDESVESHSLNAGDTSAGGFVVLPALVRTPFSFAVAPSAGPAPTGRGASLGPRAPPVLNFDLRRLAWQA